MPGLAHCPDENTLRRLVLGQSSDTEVAALEPHLLACDACGKALEALTEADSLLADARTRSPAAEHAADPTVQKLMQRLCTLRPAGDGRTREGHGETAAEALAPAGDATPFDFLGPAQGPDELGRLGPYRVLKVLGQGGMGVVFQAEDSHLQRVVAVKAMLPEVARKAAARDRFLREARATAALQHDHIVAIYHVAEEGGVPYLVMPLLKGMALETWLQRKGASVTIGQVLKIGREIAKGLAAAHAVGLIHRDIKPANVWLEAIGGGRAKILDFGLARPAAADAQITQEGMVVGTPAYMAPEQATGEKVDGRADLFSLGVVLYRMCSGRLPWKGDSALATLMAVTTQPPPPLAPLRPDLPPALDALIMQLLAKRPDDRPASAKAVVEAILAIEKSLAIGPRPPAAPASPWDMTAEPPARPKPPSVSRKPPLGLLIAAAAVAGLLLVGGGMLVWQIVGGLGPGPGASAVAKAPDRTTFPVQETGKAGKPTVPAGKQVTPEWIAAVQQLPLDKQVEAVADRLKALNPGFDGNVTMYGPKIENGAITEFQFCTDHVSDISPVRALTGLKQIGCWGSGNRTGKLADLEALRGLNLQWVNCAGNALRDLSPLRGKAISWLDAHGTNVADLTPLRGMPMDTLNVSGTAVSDLSPLAGMPITNFRCNGALVTDLTPLRGMPLQVLWCDYQPERDAPILKSIKALQWLNNRPSAEVLR